jgi:predicted Kef-type K+ transport protein
MFNHLLSRLRRALADSFVGAIALGWLFAQGIFQIVSIFTLPVSSWYQQRRVEQLRAVTVPLGFPYQVAIAPAISGLLLLIAGFLLLRWLYWPSAETGHGGKPAQEETDQ